MTSSERFCLHGKDLVFAGEKKKARLDEDKSLTSPNILREKDNQSKNQLSLEDEDVNEVDVQKLENGGRPKVIEFPLLSALNGPSLRVSCQE